MREYQYRDDELSDYVDARGRRIPWVWFSNDPAPRGPEDEQKVASSPAQESGGLCQMPRPPDAGTGTE
jgi:hypothetical protein